MIYEKSHADEFLKDGIAEAIQSDEYARSTKKGCRAGLHDTLRKVQLKNLQSGTEKIVNALFLKKGFAINTVKNNEQCLRKQSDDVVFDPDHTLGFKALIRQLPSVEKEITDKDIEVLQEIRRVNEVKHSIDYDLQEIANVRPLLDKLVGLVRAYKPNQVQA